MNRLAFLLDCRRISWLPMAFSSAAAWTWAIALLVSAQVTEKYGWNGLLWFTIPNAGALMLFGFLAEAVRRRYPEGFTLPEYIKAQYGANAHRLYLIVMLFIQICAVGVQLIGAGHILAILLGASYSIVIQVLTVLFLVFTLIRGFAFTAKLNLVHFAILLTSLLVLVPIAQCNARSVSLTDWRSGAMMGFGLQGALALLAGPPADQQHWQRAFAVSNPCDIRKMFIVAGGLFAIIPLLQGSLGFIAHELGITGQMAGVLALKEVFPIGLSALAIMLTLTLFASGSNALSAASSLGGIDIGSSVYTARLTMICVAMLGLWIALLDVPIIKLWLFYGSIRTALVSATLIAAFAPQRLTAQRLYFAVGAGISIGLPVYLWHSLWGIIALALLPAALLWLLCFRKQKDV